MSIINSSGLIESNLQMALLDMICGTMCHSAHIKTVHGSSSGGGRGGGGSSSSSSSSSV